MTTTETAEKLRESLKQLIKKEAYFREKITLSSGRESDYYIDARRITLKPEGADLCARLILDKVKDDSPDAVGGPTLGADPLLGAVGVISLRRGSPVNAFIIRKSPKAHGKQQRVEGPLLKPGDRVVLVDDVATTGKAFLDSLDVMDGMGVKVIKAVCIVDRGEGAREALAQRGCELESLIDISEIHT